MEAIKFEKVHFAYDAEERTENDVFTTDVAFSLKGIDFSVKQGEFVAVLGHNGSGKSTLARLTNGLRCCSRCRLRSFRALRISTDSSIKYRFYRLKNKKRVQECTLFYIMI